MNRKIRYFVAIFVFVLCVVIGNWPGGSNIKDEWDNLIKWAKGSKKGTKK